MKIGNSEIEKLYIGEDEVDKLYLGTDLIYENSSGPDYRTMPLTFEIISGGTIVWKANNTAYTVTLEYSKNGGEWTEITSNTGTSAPTITVESGDKVQFRGNNEALATNDSRYNTFSGTTCTANLYGNIMSLLYKDSFATATTLQTTYTFLNLFRYCAGLTDASTLILPATALEASCYRNMFQYCSSLTAAPSLPATTLASYCYNSMFYNCSSLTAAPSLPATILTSNCYNSMFYNCTSLTAAPSLPATTLASECYKSMFENTNVLPDCSSIDFSSATVVSSGGLRGLFMGTKVTDNDLRQILPINSLTNNYYLPVNTLARYCYQDMFQNCTNLTTAPELPATVLADYCYRNMFSNCTSLTTAPELPATTLASECYKSMFYNCTSLTTAPELPATTLVYYCYNNMFQNCTNLTTAPELPATTLANSCYRSMFLNCVSLNYIKCLATDISASNCTNNWVSGVASTGTFVKDTSMTSWTEGASGIPTGWTVQDNV